MKITAFFYSSYIKLTETVSSLYSSLIKRIFSIFKASIAQSVGAIEKNGMSQSQRDIAIQKAAANGYLATLKTLFASGPISGYAKEAALIEAVKQGPLAIVEELLTHGGISKEKRRDAIMIALVWNKGSLESVDPFLNIKPKDLDSSQWAALLQDTKKQIIESLACARTVSKDLIQKFLLSNDDANQEMAKIAARLAVYQGHVELVKSLILDDKLGGVIYAVMKIEAQNNAHKSSQITQYCLEVLKKRFNKPKDLERLSSIEVLSKAGLFIYSALRNYIENKPISNKMRKMVLLARMGGRKPELLKYVLRCAPVPLDDRLGAVRQAIRVKYPFLISVLLKKNKFFDLKKNEAFAIQIMRDLVDLRHIELFSMPMVSLNVLAKTVIYALEKRHQQVVLALINPCLKIAPLISVENRGQLAVILTDKGDLKSLHILLESGPILDSDFKDCIKYGEARLELAASDTEEKKAKAMIEVLEKCAITTERAILVKSRKIALGDNTHIKRSDMALGAYAGLSEETIKLLEMEA